MVGGSFGREGRRGAVMARAGGLVRPVASWTIGPPRSSPIWDITWVAANLRHNQRIDHDLHGRRSRLRRDVRAEGVGNGDQWAMPRRPVLDHLRRREGIAAAARIA